MVIDIDSFLDKFEKENKNKISLDFQKDVEDKINAIKKDSQNKDIFILKEVYDEVKKFNKDLPNKFFGIENKGREILNELGEKYSEEFLKMSQINSQNIFQKVNSLLTMLDDKMKISDYTGAINIYGEIINELKFFPKTHLNEKTQLIEKIREKEIEIYSKMLSYKKERFYNIKEKLLENTRSLKIQMRGTDIQNLERSISQVEFAIDNIPKFFLSELAEIKIKMLGVLKDAQNLLLNKYYEEFNYKEQIINELFEKFHNFYIHKNLVEILFTYNEILIEFKSLPDVFLERKIDMYKNINHLFSKVNKIILNKNILLMIESYEYSKKVDAIREYLRHVEITGTHNIENLTQISQNIKKLPKQYDFVKDEFEQKINDILKNKHIDMSKNKEILQNVKKEKSINPRNNIIINTTKLNINEIDALFIQLKNSTDQDEIKNTYRKLILKLNMNAFKPEIKSKLITKINKELHSKKLL